MRTDFLTTIYIIVINMITAFTMLFDGSTNYPYYYIFYVYSIWFFISIFTDKFSVCNNVERFSLYAAYIMTMIMTPFILFKFYMQNFDLQIFIGLSIVLAVSSIFRVYKLEKSREKPRSTTNGKTDA
jgi:hypothetical protein